MLYYFSYRGLPLLVLLVLPPDTHAREVAEHLALFLLSPLLALQLDLVPLDAFSSQRGLLCACLH